MMAAAPLMSWGIDKFRNYSNKMSGNAGGTGPAVAAKGLANEQVGLSPSKAEDRGAAEGAGKVIEGGSKIVGQSSEVTNLVDNMPELTGTTRDKLLSTIQNRDLYKITDQLYVNIFSITVLEILGNDKTILQIANKYMGPRTKQLQVQADKSLGRLV